jgi:hypothetical protein
MPAKSIVAMRKPVLEVTNCDFKLERDAKELPDRFLHRRKTQGFDVAKCNINER